MISYDYICENCNHEIHDVEQSIKDKPKKICPSCGKHGLARVLYGGAFCSVSKDPSTIGQLADRNAKKAGRQKMSEVEAKARENQPSSTIDREIRQMSEKQKMRYIMEGKK
jgi:putative FmdB family regulatory protein